MKTLPDLFKWIRSAYSCSDQDILLVPSIHAWYVRCRGVPRGEFLSDRLYADLEQFPKYRAYVEGFHKPRLKPFEVIW